jgi:preprotein translocase subunit SecE
VNNLTKILIWVAVIGVVFAIAWWKGYLLQIANYVRLTREELRKCSWPTWDELKGSTVLVAISIALLGAFTFVVDLVFVQVVTWISKI